VAEFGRSRVLVVLAWLWQIRIGRRADSSTADARVALSLTLVLLCCCCCVLLFCSFFGLF
jgi:hypothetical protein